MTVSPVPFGGGNEVPVHIRYVRVEGGVVKKFHYFNNFAQNCESTSINTSEPSSQYYANLLDQARPVAISRLGAYSAHS